MATHAIQMERNRHSSYIYIYNTRLYMNCCQKERVLLYTDTVPHPTPVLPDLYSNEPMTLFPMCIETQGPKKAFGCPGRTVCRRWMWCARFVIAVAGTPQTRWLCVRLYNGVRAIKEPPSARQKRGRIYTIFLKNKKKKLDPGWKCVQKFWPPSKHGHHHYHSLCFYNSIKVEDGYNQVVTCICI